MTKTKIQARAAMLLAILATLAACGTTRESRREPSRPVEAPAVRGDEVRAAEAPAAQPGGSGSAPAAEIAPAAPGRLERIEIVVPGTTSKLALAAVPGADGAGPIFVATTEITWDMYDAFVFAMDRAETERDPPDAFARPSKPYILMDRGFGHAGYPAISVSFRGAREFCRWLSAKTGRRFRLPTESEWERAARGGVEGYAPALDDAAWYASNSKAKGRASTRPVGRKAANGYGLHDVLGNAAEWTVGPDGAGVLRGGSFRDPAEAVTIAARVLDDPAFNATDPQVPKSVWWLADGAFAGFRIVCDP